MLVNRYNVLNVEMVMKMTATKLVRSMRKYVKCRMFQFQVLQETSLKHVLRCGVFLKFVLFVQSKPKQYNYKKRGLKKKKQDLFTTNQKKKERVCLHQKV